MTNETTPTRPPASDPACGHEPQWQDEWVPKDKVIRSGNLQVRHKLNAGAVSSYRARTDAGSQPPLIKLGRSKSGQLFLLDGFHRWEAGALEELNDAIDGRGIQVRALVATMSDREMEWQAAKANMGHGVQLKKAERPNVFKAYVRARKHRKGAGFKSYREMAADLGISKSTLARWMQSDFPSVARAMGNEGHAVAPGGLNESERVCPAEALALEARGTFEGMRPHLLAMTPEGRWQAIHAARAFIAEAEALGVSRPLEEAAADAF